MRTGPAPEGLSRRALFGAGLGRVLRERVDAQDRAAAPTPPPPAPAPLRGWGEGDGGALGARLGPVADALLGACGLRPGDRLLDPTAGDGAVALRAARAGVRVVAVERSADLAERGRASTEAEGLDVEWHVGGPTGVPAGDATVDAVASLFGFTYAPDARAATAEVARVLRPGGTVALAAWTGLMAEVLKTARRGDVRPERWARYEHAYLHLFDWPELDVVEPAPLTWRFADADAAAAELAAPAPDPEAFRVPVRALIADRARPDEGGGLALEAAWALVFARRP